MKRYRYILMDWDGNLARTLDIWHAALKLALENRGYHLSDQEIGANFEAFRERFDAKGHDGAEAIIEEAGAIAAGRIPHVELYPDALEVLESLHKSNKKIALVTSSLHKQINPLLKSHNMRHLFDVVVCGDDTRQIKPHAGPIK